ncbi:hypothetical protein JOD31_001701 [Methylopila capsulata]|uniref:Uncharacterized protein n=1 Tax=Methylopila capsulata TaxID=61654 RepID=A0ABS2T5K4_9HYPH|nr:hypothetical protein [Methylopila capsulata]MBM7851476.1 hypothetical protein [Methylopila capsulata]
MANFRPRPSDLEATIRRLAIDPDNVRWRSQAYETHAEKRQGERDIFDDMMFDVLRTGYLAGDIEPGSRPGEWKAKMCKAMRGRREIGVITIVINMQKLFVKTVEWEDLR